MQVAVATEQGNHNDAEYHAFLQRVQSRFASRVGDGTPLFSTDADGLWLAYINAMPPADQQHHVCHACRHFIERFGGLVTIDDSGAAASAIWNEEDADEHYRPSIAAMARLARRAKVAGVFLSSDPVWGQPITGPWRHLAVTPPKTMVWKHPILTAGQAMAEKREDRKNVLRGLMEFPVAVLDQALTLLETDSLYRSERVIGPARWMRELHTARTNKRGADNLTWRAIALAPAGFCHPRSSMVGTLLDDIAAGMEFGEVSRRFKEKMHPLQYQRPQAAPTAGAIAQAEKVMEQLGATGSLARRFARIDEIEAIWRPEVEPEVTGGGVFGHLKPKGAETPTIRVPKQTVTWAKFLATVLPTAKRMDLLAPSAGNYSALVTAVNAEAPPILQWDREDRRNPFSGYVYHGGSTAAQWNITARSWVPVTAIAPNPHLWFGGEYPHMGQGAVIVMQGARDTRNDGAGAGLFPEILRSEFHGVRSVIEAYSKSAKIEGADTASACGMQINAKGTIGLDVRVTLAGGSTLEYRIDRWD